MSDQNSTKKSKSQMTIKSIPALKWSATSDQIIDFKKLKGQAFVLFFYPKDSTPGCTQEGKDFTQLHTEFKKQGFEIFAVSRDSLSSHEKFKNKQKYSFDLISDTDGELCEAFGVLKKKSMFGKTFTGIERSTFVISDEGSVLKEWRKVKVLGHAKEVLVFVKSLNLN